MDFRTYNSDINACERAIKERLFYVKEGESFVPPPKPKPGIFALKCKEFVEKFAKEVSPVSPLSKQAFVDSYQGRQRTIYANALASLRLRAFRRSDSFISFFVKCEKVNFTLKFFPAPRGISPRSPRYHVMLGPYIKRIEHTIYGITEKIFGFRAIFKGLNAADSGKTLKAHWDHFDDPVAIGLDASRFDQHVSYDALRFEHSFYTRFFPGIKELRELLDLQLINKGYANVPDGRAKFTLRGGRMSGDMNTGLGNCLLMVAMMHAYMVHAKISKYRLANNGDDCVLIIERGHLKRIGDLKEFFLDFGFNMVTEPVVDVFEKIEFCQTQPVWTPEGYIMVRNLHISVPKDCLILKPASSVKLINRMMMSIGLCGMSLTGGIPVVQEFYKCMIDQAEGAKILTDPTLDTGMARLAKGMQRKYKEVHWRTRVSFWRAFGLDPHKQECLEGQYRNLIISKDLKPCDTQIRSVVF